MFKARLNVYLLFISIFVINGFLFSQTSADYQTIYKNIIKNSSTPEEYHLKLQQFFNSLDNKNLAFALPTLSKEYDANFIAFNFFKLINHRLEDNDFRNQLVKQLNDNTNTDEFRIITIDFITKNIQKKSDEMISFNKILQLIAKNNGLSDYLRFYAAAHINLSSDYSIDEQILNEMLNNNNLAVVNGASRSLRNYISPNLTQIEINKWVEILTNVIETKIENLNTINSTIITLGLMGTEKAKKHLLSLFYKYSLLDTEITDLIVLSLSNTADKEVLNKIFNVYLNNENFNRFSSELTLNNIVNNNMGIIADANNSEDLESKLLFLRSVRYIERKTLYIMK